MTQLKIRSSDICNIRTPAEFYQKKFLHEPEQKDYFDIGTAAHAYILEPETFKDIIIVANEAPEPDKINMDGSLKKTGENGKYINQVKKDNPDKIVFEPYWYRQVIAYANSIVNIPGFESLINLKTGLAEHTMKRQYAEDCELNGRADYIKPGKFISDLKFSKSVDDFEINKSFKNYEYHLRSAFYTDLWNFNNPENKIDMFIYIIVEKSVNPVARFLTMSETDINAGRQMYKQRLNAIMKAYRKNDWIKNSIESLDLPDWVYEKNTNF